MPKHPTAVKREKVTSKDRFCPKRSLWPRKGSEMPCSSLLAQLRLLTKPSQLPVCKHIILSENPWWNLQAIPGHELQEPWGQWHMERSHSSLQGALTAQSSVVLRLLMLPSVPSSKASLLFLCSSEAFPVTAATWALSALLLIDLFFQSETCKDDDSVFTSSFFFTKVTSFA